MKPVELNLYRFYDGIAQLPDVAGICSERYHEVRSNGGYWPRLIYALNQGIAPSILLPEISSEIANGKLSSFLLAPESYLNRNHRELLKELGMMPVKLMCGMSLRKQELGEIVQPPDTQIRDLTGPDQINAFVMLANETLMSEDMPLSLEMISNMQQTMDVRIVGLFYNDVLVSSVLVYLHENVAGIYFVCTAKNYQRKGFATFLLLSLMKRLFAEGIDEIILHANNSSARLYESLGFEKQLNFIVYKK